MEPNTTVQILEKGVWKSAVFLEETENNNIHIEIDEKTKEFSKGIIKHYNPSKMLYALILNPPPHGF
jgi:hypothetical protein